MASLGARASDKPNDLANNFLLRTLKGSVIKHKQVIVVRPDKNLQRQFVRPIHVIPQMR